jgi:hypothetical protein
MGYFTKFGTPMGAFLPFTPPDHRLNESKLPCEKFDSAKKFL